MSLDNGCKRKEKQVVDTVDIKVSGDLVKPIVEAKIQAAIVAAMGDDPAVFVEAMVAKALGVKVNEKGREPSYSHEKTVSYLEWMCGDIIRKAAVEAMRKWAEENTDTIEAAILKEFHSKSGTARLAKAISEGMTESIQSTWNFSCTVQSEKE